MRTYKNILQAHRQEIPFSNEWVVFGYFHLPTIIPVGVNTHQKVKPAVMTGKVCL